jgi:replicative DNA helicase
MIDYRRLLGLRVNAREADLDPETLKFMLLEEISGEAVRLYGQGWHPMDIRRHAAEMNRALLEDALPKDDIDAALTARLEEEERRRRRIVDAPGEHLARLRKEVQSWGETYSFTLGISGLDESWGGIMPGEIAVIVGAQGSMKTSLALNGVEHFLRENQDGTVLFFSLDMTTEELSARIIMRDLGVSHQEVYGMMREQNLRYLQAERAFAEATKGRLKMLGNTDNSRWTIEGVEWQVALRKPDLVVIDFLTMLKKPGQSDLEAVEEIMPRLQATTQRLRIKTLILSQMARASKNDQAKGITGGHSKGGGIVEELAHSEIELYRDKGEDDNEPPRIIATITKTRRGVSGASYELAYRGRQMEFTGQTRRVQREKRKPIFSAVSPLA